MNKTRRQFGLLSGLGIGTAFANRSLPLPSGRLERRTVRIQEDPSFSCTEVNLARGRGPETVAAFCRAQEGCDTGDIVLARSSDGEETWRQSAEPLFRQGHQLASLVRLGDGTLIAATTKFRFLFGGKLRWRRGAETDGVYTRASIDGGHSWSDIRKVETSPFHVAWTRGSIVEMPDGSLLLPLAGQRGESYRAAHHPIESFLLRSVDRGTSWRFLYVIARDPASRRDFDEPTLVSLGGRGLLCMLRSHESPRRDPPGGYLYVAHSEDGGAIWSEARKTSLWGHPAHLLRLRDGRILCTFGYRMHPDPGVRGCVSENGSVWKPEDIFTSQSTPELDSEHLQIGCPSSVMLDDGGILTAYQVWNGERRRLEGSVYHL